VKGSAPLRPEPPPPELRKQHLPCQTPTSEKGTRPHQAKYTYFFCSHLRTLRQNTDSLSALQAKVSQLRSVTIDIYDNARDQHVLDSTTDTFSTMGTSLKGSARRLGVMASQGNKVAVLKLAGIIVGVVVLLYWIASFFW